MKLRIFVFVILHLVPGVLCAQGTDTPVLLFHLSFDGPTGRDPGDPGATLVADTAGGRREPVDAPDTPLFVSADGEAVAGRAGSALKLGSDTTWRLAYATAGNLNLSAGTLSFRVKYPGDFSKKPAGLLFETGKPEDRNHIEIRFGWSGRRENGFWLRGYFHVKRLRPSRLTVADWGDRVVSTWQPDEWHHVMVVWDSRRGVTKYYDGMPAAGPPTDNGTFLFLDAGPEMRLGPANLVVDDIRIYDRPMTPWQLGQLTGFPPAPNLPEQRDVTYHYVK